MLHRLFFLATALLTAGQTPVFAQSKLFIPNTTWSGTHSPIKKGTELYFQGDTLVLLDLDGIQPVDQYRFSLQNDTLLLYTLEEYSVACREEGAALYRLFHAQNGEKLLLKPIQDNCMPRFTRLVSESPWYRKREAGETRLDWHFLDPEKDRVAGAGLYEAYKLLKIRKSSPIRVAVIDSPVDYSHEDLASQVWANEKEKDGNKTDDDQNGFRDDVRGWFFAASKQGIPVRNEQHVSTQIVAMWGERFSGADPGKLSGKDKEEFETYQKARKMYEKGARSAQALKVFFSDSARLFPTLNRFLMQSEEPLTSEQIDSWKTDGSDYEKTVQEALKELVQASQIRSMQILMLVLRNRLSVFRGYFENRWRYEYNLDYKPRELVGDHPEIPYEKMYGSGYLQNPGAEENEHGTHVAGIMAARRGNGKGVEGVADNIRFITLGAVPQGGDERDKDVANCIRYAVDQGAKIINMSFAKKLSPHPATVEEAIRYAEKKGVLLFHAAGNSGLDRDTIEEYPNPRYRDGTVCSTWIEVGNNTPSLDAGLVNSTSSYGKKTVDLFAPGTDIYSTLPGNQYGAFSGTSMATPLTAGIAALIWSYFPTLTAREMRQVLMESVYKLDVSVRVPGSSKEKKFSELSVSGGIVNARNAVFAAERLSRKGGKGKK